jgi:hypothetical protein
MVRLNQIIAVEKGIKSKTNRELTDAHHLLQKQGLLNGMIRTYQPDREDDETFPQETVKLQIKADDMVRNASKSLIELFDVTLAKDTANCMARADVTVDGVVIAKSVPVTTLLFLEKQLNDLYTFFKKVPVLDPAETWHYDNNQGCYLSNPVQTAKSRKEPQVVEKAKATDHHPAQVDVIYVDRRVGTWTSIKHSSAWPQEKVNKILTKIEALQKAVKFSREEANNTEVAKASTSIGEQVFNYLF